MPFRLAFAKASELKFLERRTGIALASNACGLVALDAALKIRGAVAYDSWSPNSCEMHHAFDTPIAMRCLMRDAFIYPFLRCGLGVMFARVRADNPRGLRSATKYGFNEIFRFKDGWRPGVDMVLMQMRREDCRWIRGLEKEAA